MRATEVIIDLSKLKSNAVFLQEKAQGREVMGILKADAYGHGAIPVLKTLTSLGWKYFGVATIEEALEIRKVDPKIDILLLGATSIEDFPVCVENNLSFAVHDRQTLMAALALQEPAKIHIKVDTGMHRLGFALDELHKFSEEIAALNPVGIYTHLATAEEDKAYALSQVARFKEAVDVFRKRGLTFKWVHYGNSAALLEMDLSFSNMVRAGIVLYGYSPVFPVEQLQPIMSLRSRILAVRELAKGEGLSYGHVYVAKSARRIATVPVGYADGYKRQMSGEIFAWIGDRKCPQVGRITMDQAMFDITGVDAMVGDEVELMGEHIPCACLAEAAQSNRAEIMVTIGKRVRRIYLGD